MNPMIFFTLSALLDDKSIHTFKHKITPSPAFGDINSQIMGGGNNIEIQNGNIKINHYSESLGNWNILYNIDGKKQKTENFPITFPPENVDKIINPFKFGRFVNIWHRKQLKIQKFILS